MITNEIRRLRAIIETAMQSVDEKTASEAPTLFPLLKGNGALIRGGTMIQFNGSVFRAGADLWDTPENTPDKAPTLWATLTYRDGIRIIPSPITTVTAFDEGECGWWRDQIFRSKVNHNVFTPDEYAENWEVVQ